MLISLIAAMSENKVIGRNNSLPWDLPEELKLFREYTLGKPILMGRKTFESIGKPLPKRKNIVLTRDRNFGLPEFPEVQVVFSGQAAIEAAKPCEELMVIGGAKIYQEFLPLADRLYLTTVLRTVEGDTYFPDFELKDWNLKEERAYPDFVSRIYNRIKK